MIVVIESPFNSSGHNGLARNIAFARACVKDSLSRGEAPFASHLLYTQPGILNDNVKPDRDLGIRAGFKVAEHFDLTAVYTNLGISKGMQAGIEDASEKGRKIEFRELEPGWLGEDDGDLSAPFPPLP